MKLLAFFLERRRAAMRADKQRRLLALSAGRLRCPFCGDDGPHDDNGCFGNAPLAFWCRRCKSLFRISDYDWFPERKDPQ